MPVLQGVGLLPSGNVPGTDLVQSAQPKPIIQCLEKPKAPTSGIITHQGCVSNFLAEPNLGDLGNGKVEILRILGNFQYHTLSCISFHHAVFKQ